MRHSWFSDLRLTWKLLVPYVAILVIVGVFGAFLLVREESSRAQARMNEDLLEAALEARGLLLERELYLLEAANLGANLRGMADAVEEQDAERVGGLLRSVRALKPDVSHVVVVGLDGRSLAEFAGTATQANLPGPDGRTWEERFVQQALAGRDGLKQSGFVTLGGQLMVAIAAPICRPGEGCEPVGVALAALDIEDLAAAMHERIGSASGVALFDGDGQRLASMGVAVDEALGASGAPRELVRRTDVVEDSDVHTIFAPMEIQSQPQGSVAISLSAETVFAAVGDATLRLVVLLLATLAAVIAVGAILSRMILRQVEPLIETNRALGSGDLSARAPVVSRDEIGELAAGLNQMADNLQASHDTLEVRVAQRTSEVERLLRERTDFFASLSHELRTPLAVILSEADLLLTLDDDEALGTGRAIRESAAQLLAVVNDILDLAKADAGRIELSLADTDMGELVDELRPTIEGLARGAGIEPVIEIGDELPMVRGDWLRLREIVLNLVDNAVKYTPSGGTVSISVSGSNDEVTVSVADTGPGIAEDVGDRIFEPFFRADDSTPLHGRVSTGLGLAMTRSLVDAHGGAISYSSEPGAGATFTFTIPSSRGSREAAGDALVDAGEHGSTVETT